MFVNGVDDLCPEVPAKLVALIDALVQPFNRDVSRSDAVLLDQVTGRFLYLGGHRRLLSDFFDL